MKSATKTVVAFATLTAGVLAALALATTVTAGSTAARAPSPIKVGTVTAIAGFGGIFEPFLVSLKGYFKWLNANGGINGQPVQLLAKDDTGDPAKNAAAVRQFVTEGKIVALVGEATTGAAGSQAYLALKGIPAIGGWATDGIWQQKNMFPIISSAYLPSRCAGYATDFAKAQGATKLAIIGLDYPGGRADVACYAKRAKVKGLTLVHDPFLSSLTQPDYRAIVSQALDAGAQDFIVDIGVDALIKVIQAGEQLGFKGRIITTGSLVPAAIANLGSLKSAIAGRVFGPAFAVYPPTFPPPSKGLSAQTAKELRNFAKYVPSKYYKDPFAVAGWAAGVSLTDALKAAGPSSKGLLTYMSGLRNYTAHGLLPPTSYVEVPHPPVRCVFWITYSKSGEFGPVYDNGYKPSCSDYIDAS